MIPTLMDWSYLSIFIVFLNTQSFVSPTSTKQHIDLNVEHTIRISPYTQANYYVVDMAKKNLPLYMYITPCSSSVYWQLRIPNQFILGPNIHTHSEHFDHILHMRIPPLIHYNTPSHLKDQFVLLAGEENEKRMKFYANAIEANYVVLNMTAEHFTSAKVYMSNDPMEVNKNYPSLEKHSEVNVDISLNGDNDEKMSAKFSWNHPSYLNENTTTDEYKYCLLLNDHHTQHTMCDNFNADVDSIHCFTPQTKEYAIRGLRVGKRHFATLFLINEKTGGKSAYNPVPVYMEPKVVKEDPKNLTVEEEGNTAILSLPDSALTSHNVALPKGQSNIYLYSAPREKHADELIVLLNACNGYITVTVTTNETIVYKSTDFIGYRRLVVKLTSNEDVKVLVANDDHNPVKYWIWASFAEEKSPFPAIPYDKSIRLVERHCNTVKLEWLRSLNDNDTRYCVHLKESKDDYVSDILNEPSQMCWAGMPVGRKATCLTPTSTSTDLHVPGYLTMSTTLSSLKPSTMYRFDVSAQKINQIDAQPLPYRPIFVRTTREC